MSLEIRNLLIRLLNLGQANKANRVEITGKFRLGKWLVDPKLGQISHADQEVDLQPQVMDLLVFFVERQGQIIGMDEILSSLWKDRIVTTASIYTSLKQLRAVLGDDAQNPRYIKTIPKRGYQLIAGIEHEVETDRTVSFSDKSGRDQGGVVSWWRRPGNVLLVASLLLALSAVLISINKYSWQIPISLNGIPENSIAVLPFTDMTMDQDHGWFSDGMSEEILNKLAQMPGLKVTGRQSSFNFRNSTADLPTIGRILGVSHLLEGSVRREGDKIRVTAQLIRADDGFHVWSQEFDRELSDTIAIQDEISSSVARVLAMKMPVVNQAEGTLAPVAIYPRFSAYELYLQSLELIEQNTKPSLMDALSKLEKVLQMEPDFAEAHIAISRAYLSMRGFLGFYKEDMYKESDDLIRPHLEQALTINPDLAEVQLLLGDMSDQVEEAQNAYEKALSINPSLYQGHVSLAVLAMDQLRSWNDCVLHLENALEIEPLSVGAATEMILFMQRVPHRWLEAEDMLAKLEQQYPHSPDVLRAKARWLLYVRGQPADAVSILQEILVKNPDDALARSYLLRSWYMLGETERALEFRIGNPYWRFVLAPDREASLREMADIMAEVKLWPRERSQAHRMLYAYIYVMLREWQMAIDLLGEDAKDLERLTRSQPTYVQQLGLTESLGMTLATAYKKVGDQENFKRLARFERMALNARTENGKLHNQDYSRALAKLDALEGRPYQALLELEHQIANGRIDPRDLLHPAFDVLRDDPGFRKIEQLQLQRINQERQALGLLQLQISDLQRVVNTENS